MLHGFAGKWAACKRKSQVCVFMSSFLFTRNLLSNVKELKLQLARRCQPCSRNVWKQYNGNNLSTGLLSRSLFHLISVGARWKETFSWSFIFRLTSTGKLLQCLDVALCFFAVSKRKCEQTDKLPRKVASCGPNSELIIWYKICSACTNLLYATSNLLIVVF